MDTILKGFTFWSVFSVCALIIFEVFKKLLTTIINVLFASLELRTNFENAYWNPPQITLLCDWWMFSSADLSLIAGKMRKN